LAALFSFGYLATATSVGVLLSLTPDEQSAGPTANSTFTAQPTRYPAIATTTRPQRTTTTTTTPAVPSGYRAVKGSFQLSTVVPADWTVAAGSVATVQVATDPSDARREIRFGGAPPEGAGTDLADRITKAADENTAPDYRKTSVEPSTFHGYPAMRWDFEFAKNGVRRQVSAFYWEAQNVEYVIYASTTPDDWTAVQAVVQTMKDSARP
jgi:hypothetical protein